MLPRDHALGTSMNATTKYGMRTTLLVIGLGAVLTVLVGINLVDFGLVVSGWMFFGRLVTLDDELPGGFYNPDGGLAFPKLEIAGLGLAFVGLVVLKLWIIEG